MWKRLDFIDGDFTLLFKSDIPGQLHLQIRAYHLELQQELSGIPVWPVDEVSAVLYANFGKHYHKITELLKLDCDRLTDESRHLLLVCSAPVGEGENFRPGLSYLEQLMGYSLEEKPMQSTFIGAPPPTTGDYILDVKTDLYLIFKRHAPKLWQTHSLEECALLCKQASERMKDPDEREEFTGWDKKTEVVDDEIFLEKKLYILERLSAIGVIPPEGF
ncbi:hypothetical protein VF04_03845 [Nostoc linckia z7]|uniref:Uncharacterized protein n=2 Tax=Nostoc linckia TaxID=92942 RepID=A0A9Q5ZGE4_NOSLI|nr:hypothetical protein [Nostoc linckia]PHK42990.1 hypothetical protein VF12_01310 [Nostoc linckia z15]PHK48147.1 hypothetical protein VF13_02285 [Nostoc linckia z16]PHJ64931.1 hypothetical protein VF02_11335 [Nostoc linckia z1]PHJ70108.1 hypothetical protein VF05_11490 [Nostoc linckia z3]PHJ75009.1 hypothetical protein VF03_11650 [Nostoc linckia z2]